MQKLVRFLDPRGLPKSNFDIGKTLRSDLIIEVRNFALGPDGTNIALACRE
jgi:hypothetical protein